MTKLDFTLYNDGERNLKYHYEYKKVELLDALFVLEDELAIELAKIENTSFEQVKDIIRRQRNAYEGRKKS